MSFLHWPIDISCHNKCVIKKLEFVFLLYWYWFQDLAMVCLSLYQMWDFICVSCWRKWSVSTGHISVRWAWGFDYKCGIYDDRPACKRISGWCSASDWAIYLSHMGNIFDMEVKWKCLLCYNRHEWLLWDIFEVFNLSEVILLRLQIHISPNVHLLPHSY